MMPAAVAVPLQPLILSVRKPMLGVAVQLDVLPPITGFVQVSAPFAPALAVTVY